MDAKQQKMWDALSELDGETVLGLLTDWHGTQLLDDGFYGHMVGEGYLEEPQEVDEDQRDEAIWRGDFLRYCDSYDECCFCPLRNSICCEKDFVSLLESEDGIDELRSDV